MYVKKIVNTLKKRGLSDTLSVISDRLKYKRASVKYSNFVSEKDELYHFELTQTKGKDVLISICVPVYNPKPEHFNAMLESVLLQSYDNWQLCIADAGTEGYAQKEVERCNDERISYRKLEGNHGIAINTNMAVEMAKGEYVVLLDHDDILALDCLYEFKSAVNRGVDFIYADESSFYKDPRRPEITHFKGSFSFFNLLGNNYICHPVCFKKELFQNVGGFRKGFEGSQDHDLFIRMCQEAKTRVHIPKVLYYWRIHKSSVAYDIEAKPYCVESGIKAVREYTEKNKLEARVKETGPNPIYSVVYEPKKEYELIRDITDIEYVKAPYVIYAKKGVKISDEDCTYLAGVLSNEEAGVVAPLVSCKGKIQSAGLVVGSGRIFNACYGKRVSSRGYMHILEFTHNVTAVNSCVFAMRSSLIKKVGGFDETLSEQERVTDMCLRLREFGKASLIVPYVKAEYKLEKNVSISFLFAKKWKRKLSGKDKWLREEIYG